MAPRGCAPHIGRTFPTSINAVSRPVVPFCLAVLCACSEPEPPPAPNGSSAEAEVRLEVVASGLRDPLYVTAPREDARIFIVEQGGRIRIVENGRLLDTPFLDIRSRVSAGGEQGLLSLAFHPRYASTGWFYVNYTDHAGDTRVERYCVSGNRNVADPGSARLILRVDQPFANHNGGLVLFGPDGMLYIGMGDGGSGGDPLGHGQNRGTLLGDLLRIDVDRGDPYAIPPDNPFVGRAGMRGEIWAYGLRNPWRFDFDPASGLLYIADVGQNQWEEINAAPLDQGGLNYGWNIMEGAHCYARNACDRTGLVAPILEYDHGDGCSITGGLVYRGARIPAIVGHYCYAAWCEGWIRRYKYHPAREAPAKQWAFGDVGRITSFGEDAAGELYVTSGNGNVYRFVPAR
ncbi:MAG: PQQ-dependent sugar dehydrogenase [Gemmatimonadetes bacterium]|nr:PQQ-dependent sugar dehydrogenase [Gemmatimonadota bacterium]